MNYTIPPETRVGHIHLKVSDIEKSLGFYQDILGFQLTQRFGTQAAFLSSSDYHHHIGLNTWQTRGAPTSDSSHVGLYHTAFLYPTRRDLAEILARLMELKYPLSGFADHGVSEAIYLSDPDGNGVELYWDKAQEMWPKNADGGLDMYTRELDIADLLAEAKK